MQLCPLKLSLTYVAFFDLRSFSEVGSEVGSVRGLCGYASAARNCVSRFSGFGFAELSRQVGIGSSLRSSNFVP